MKICEYCGKQHYGTFATGRFCNRSCSNGFSTKNKRKEINEKVSRKLTKNKIIYKVCLNCNNIFTTKSINKKFCNNYCSNKYKPNNKEYIKKISDAAKNRCKNINERMRLREIGRKGGFGKKGYTLRGNRFESIFEKDVFNFLEDINCDFKPHKFIPNSSKVCDLYIPKFDIWIELDGINREKKKKYLGKSYFYWISKIEEYNYKKLNYKIFYNFEEFKKWFIKQS